LFIPPAMTSVSQTHRTRVRRLPTAVRGIRG
jgi:hypothetical protein